jgi:hydroxymethylglutaryl-CoA reductase (NADPH)
MALAIPSMILKKLYTVGSLENTADGYQFNVKNRLSDAELTELIGIKIDKQEIDKAQITLSLGDGRSYKPDQITADTPLPFPLRQVIRIHIQSNSLPEGKHDIELAVRAKPFGKLKFTVDDAITETTDHLVRIPRDDHDDYGEASIKKRQAFVENYSGHTLQHIPHYSFDPHTTAGNIEHFTGVAQIPIGFAGPITIHGEHAQGDFIVPMATTEGTLVASYNRGIKVVNLSGGVKVSVVDDAMQRAPVFVFDDARQSRDFVTWVNENIDKIREEAEATSSVAKLQYIDPFLASKFTFLRFNYSTGDAAGQNMVGRATFAACGWILDNYPADKIKHFYLESNLATDKKASQVNLMRTRGKRVTAEAIIKRDVLIQQMRVEPSSLTYHSQIANVGAILSGANNNGAHSPNGITAIFIATGQDVANVSESSAAIIYSELLPNGDMYFSITIPSLIVATYGGGTGLATQRECLEILDCYGRDKVRKFAEIIAGVVLAGEISLGAAISSSDWVSSHEQYGRNR